MHVAVTHSTKLGHFQKDPMLTEAAQATINDNHITFHLFQYFKN